MLNLERLKELRNKIADENTFFDMESFSVRKEQYNSCAEYRHEEYGIFPENACESPACVCGWLNHMAFHDKNFPYINREQGIISYADADSAVEYLGFTRDSDEGTFLFRLFDATGFTRENVVEVLDDYIAKEKIVDPFTLWGF